MVGLTKNSFFRHQWAIKWQRLPRIEIFEFLLFLAQKWPIMNFGLPILVVCTVEEILVNTLST